MITVEGITDLIETLDLEDYVEEKEIQELLTKDGQTSKSFD